MSEPRGPVEDEPTQLNHRGTQPPPFWTSAGAEPQTSLAPSSPGPAGGRGNRAMWAVAGAVVGLAVVVFLLVVMVTQHSQHDAPTPVSSTTRPSAGTSPTSVAFPSGLSTQCVGEDGKKTTITIERVRQGTTSVAGSCRFLRQVRDEVDRRGTVTQSYETNLHSDFLAARGKPAWVLLTCSPDRGLTICRGGTPELEIWVQPKG